MRILEMQVNALMRLCAAEQESEQAKAREEVRQMLRKASIYRPSADPEYLVRELLLELGAPDHLTGHDYVVQAILLVLQDRSYVNRITYGLYPRLAVLFDTSPARIERAIRHLIEVTWTRGDWDTLGRCFGNTVSAEKGKPTNSEFIARMSNIVKQRLLEAA